jgi:hypothetical protein
MLLKQLRGLGVEIAEDKVEGRYRRYVGDMNALGKGEILVWEGK